MTIAFSALIIGVFLLATLHPDSLEVFQKVLGPYPAGMPLRLFIALLAILILIPVPVAARHISRILVRGMSESRYHRQ